MNQPLISIIIPIHNDEKYLSRCLDSIVNQTLQDIEVICINDASTDSTALILEDYEANYKIIKVIRFEQNRSAYMARIYGVSIAQGKYIMFVDGDDYLDTNACNDLYKLIEKNSVDILHFSVNVINSGNVYDEKRKRVVRHIRPYYGTLSGDSIQRFFFPEKWFTSPLWNKIYNTNVCKKAFSRLPEHYLPKANDVVASFVIISEAQTYKGINTKPYYHYSYGFGSTGKKVISIDNLRIYAYQSLIPKILSEIMESNTYNFSSEADILSSRYYKSLTRCIDNWINNLPDNDFLEGFNVICDFWNEQEIIDMLYLEYNRHFENVICKLMDRCPARRKDFLSYKTNSKLRLFPVLVALQRERKSFIMKIGNKIKTIKFLMQNAGISGVIAIMKYYKWKD